MRQELEEDILPFWQSRMVDDAQGGFLGRIDGEGKPHPDAEKGAILNARILWAFSAAFRVTRDERWFQVAERAKLYIMSHFVDLEHGGVYWSLNADGTPRDTKKQTYAIGFTIYGLSEIARATGDLQALDCAISLYHDIEAHAFDREHNGYIEALTRDWQPIGDMRLSDKDENASRTMNTHLHVIEPYTNLLRCLNELLAKGNLGGDTSHYEAVRKEVYRSTVNLLEIFNRYIINKSTFHLDLFFNDCWKGRRNVQSYGHDIEAAWLLHETALELGDEDLLHRMRPVVVNIARAADDGLQPDGSLIYEHWNDGRTDRQRQWWVMCENIIGHIDIYQYFGDEQALKVAADCWQFVKNHLIDYKGGEWFWSVDDHMEPNRKDDKAGFWKCPYHNSRMCLEIMERFSD
ncbi:MAG: AGE family epimerase/isomerase [Prevotella sp.]